MTHTHEQSPTNTKQSTRIPAVTRKHHANDKNEFRESRLVPEKLFRFKNEIIIFENKVAIVSLSEQMGFVIESVDVAETQRSFFELAWLGAGKTK